MVKIIPSRSSTESAACRPHETKSVSFKSTVQVCPILHIHDFTKEEIQDCWITRSEMQEMKMNLKACIKVACRADFLMDDDSEVCLRGLESWMPLESVCRRQRRHEAICAVLREQQIQRDTDIKDEDIIADAYQECAGCSEYVARITAKKDEQFVKDHLETSTGAHIRPFRRFAITRKTACYDVSALERQCSKRRLTLEGSVISAH